MRRSRRNRRLPRRYRDPRVELGGLLGRRGRGLPARGRVRQVRVTRDMLANARMYFNQQLPGLLRARQVNPEFVEAEMTHAAVYIEGDEHGVATNLSRVFPYVGEEDRITGIRVALRLRRNALYELVSRAMPFLRSISDAVIDTIVARLRVDNNPEDWALVASVSVVDAANRQIAADLFGNVVHLSERERGRGILPPNQREERLVNAAFFDDDEDRGSQGRLLLVRELLQRDDAQLNINLYIWNRRHFSPIGLAPRIPLVQVRIGARVRDPIPDMVHSDGVNHMGVYGVHHMPPSDRRVTMYRVPPYVESGVMDNDCVLGAIYLHVWGAREAKLPHEYNGPPLGQVIRELVAPGGSLVEFRAEVLAGGITLFDAGVMQRLSLYFGCSIVLESYDGARRLSWASLGFDDESEFSSEWSRLRKVRRLASYLNPRALYPPCFLFVEFYEGSAAHVELRTCVAYDLRVPSNKAHQALCIPTGMTVCLNCAEFVGDVEAHASRRCYASGPAQWCRCCQQRHMQPQDYVFRREFVDVRSCSICGMELPYSCMVNHLYQGLCNSQYVAQLAYCTSCRAPICRGRLAHSKEELRCQLDWDFDSLEGVASYLTSTASLHKCGRRLCTACHKWHDIDPKASRGCYMLTPDERAIAFGQRPTNAQCVTAMVTYDLETTADTRLFTDRDVDEDAYCGSRMKLVLACWQLELRDTWDRRIWKPSPQHYWVADGQCESDGITAMVVNIVQCIYDYNAHAVGFTNKVRAVEVVAHNAFAFDCGWVYSSLISDHFRDIVYELHLNLDTEDLLLNQLHVQVGSKKFSYLTWRFTSKLVLHFRDSFRLAPSSLARLASSCGIRTPKGISPYCILQPPPRDLVADHAALMAYTIHLPDLRAFLLNKDPSSARGQDVVEQYCDLAVAYGGSEPRYPIYAEQLKYCQLDVDILHRVMVKLNYKAAQIRDIEPWVRSRGKDGKGVRMVACATAASFAIRLYCNVFMARLAKEERACFLSNRTDLARFVRRSYRGGRTENFALYCNAREIGARIVSFDITSSYPHVMRRAPIGIGPYHFKTFDSPVDGRAWFVANYADFYSNEQQACIEITDLVCPERLYIPLLGVKQELDDGGPAKLVYSLQPSKPDQTLVFMSPILVRAWSLGYRFSVCRAVVSERVSTDTFASFVDELMAMKDNATARGDKAARLTAKIGLNSLYGKMGEDTRHVHTQIFSSLRELVSFIDDPDIEPLSLRRLERAIDCEADESYKFQLRFKSQYGTEATAPNVFVASIITTFAQMHLFEAMRAVGPSRLLYCDTDSVYMLLFDEELDTTTDESYRQSAKAVFERLVTSKHIWRGMDGAPERLAVDAGLGSWELEQTKLGDTGTKFYSIGPKSRWIATQAGQSDVKMKGVSLNASTHLLDVEDTWRDLITRDRDEYAVFAQQEQFAGTFERTYVRVNTKRVRAVALKRQVSAPARMSVQDMLDEGYSAVWLEPFGWR